MSQYVLLISVGPVQSMILAARKSRDLWSGSWLLSELAKATAEYLYKLDQIGKDNLVFPYTDHPDNDLKAGSSFSVGNKIQVVVSAGSAEEVRQIAESAKQAARNAFYEMAEASVASLKKKQQIRQAVWDQQIDDYIEVQVAWAKITNGNQGYLKASQLAAEVLASRKSSRNFSVQHNNPFEAGLTIPKSALDGIRETVLPENNSDLLLNVRRQLDLSRTEKMADSEQLDTLALTKRLGASAKVEQFTSFSRVTAHAWLGGLNETELKQLNEAYEPLVALDLATRTTGNEGAYEAFAYDAQLLYVSRLERELEDCKASNDLEAYDALSKLRDTLKPIWKDKGQPCSYGVLLLADGDKMGELLDAAKNQKEHQDITKALSAFAGQVAQITRKHAGHTIYAGGDDVLAMLPLYSAYKAAKELSELFTKSLKHISDTLKTNTPTLSVGLAIAHMMTPFGIIRQLAGQAEKTAKGDHLAKEKQRNALGITLSVRSGNITHIRLRWDDAEAQNKFALWQEFYREKFIPSRIAYDTREIHLRTAFAQQQKNEHANAIQKAEFDLMLSRARTNQGQKLEKEHVAKLNERHGQLKNLAELANELIVARWLSAKSQKDLGDEK